ncbi:MAG: class I SAM-dependent methyltransferase, partial [Fimbriiglobus sp.]
EFARRRLPYPGKHRTADEKPLTPVDVTGLRVHFPNLTLEPHQFLGMVRRVCRWRPLLARLDAADRRLFRAAPSLGKWCRYVVLELPSG